MNIPRVAGTAVTIVCFIVASVDSLGQAPRSNSPGRAESYSQSQRPKPAGTDVAIVQQYGLRWMGLSLWSTSDFIYEETSDLGLVADQFGPGHRYFYFDPARQIRVVASFRRSIDADLTSLEALAVEVVEHDQAGFVSTPAVTDTFLGLPSATSSGSTAGGLHLSVRVLWHPAVEHYLVVAATSKIGVAAANEARQDFESTMQLTSE
jgi:hypothetical protein